MEGLGRQKIVFLILFAFLVTGFFLELSYQTTHINHRGVYQSPILWLLGSVLFCLSALFLGRHSENFNRSSDKHTNLFLFIGLFILAMCCYEGGSALSRIFTKFPVDAAGSDIVPSIQFYVRRLLSGEHVYAPMPFDGYTLQPTYLTFMWFPFIPAEMAGIDYRWMAFFYFCLMVLIWAIYSLLNDCHPIEWLMKVSMCGMMVILTCKHVPDNFKHSIELLPVAIYLLLCLTILHQKSWIVAAGILLCLLSRYSFTFWLPVYLLILWGERGFRFVLRVGLLVLAGVLLFYFIPFIGKDIEIFINGLKYYNENALSKWSPFSWQPEGAKPYHLSRGLGLAVQYYSSHEGELIDRLHLLRKTQLIVSLIAALATYLGYRFVKKKNYDIKLFLLITLKLYIVLFYSFLHVPYTYLFLLPCLLSIPVLFHIRLIRVNSSK